MHLDIYLATLMNFNIFSDLYKDNETNPTLKERLRDTFLVFFGRGLYTYVSNDGHRLGLFDYLCFFIPTLLRKWANKLQDPLHIIFAFSIIVILEFIPRALISLLFTLCVVPFVFLIHFTLGKSFDEFIIPLITRGSRLLVQEKIEEALAEGNPDLALCDGPKNELLASPGMINFLIEQLNKHPSITILRLDTSITDGALTKFFIILNPSAPPTGVLHCVRDDVLLCIDNFLFTTGIVFAFLQNTKTRGGFINENKNWFCEVRSFYHLCHYFHCLQLFAIFLIS